MMLLPLQRLVARGIAWACPAALPGQESSHHEAHRRRMTHFLLAILAIGFCTGILSAFPDARAMMGISLLIVISGALYLFLCHLRRVRLASWLYALANCSFISVATIAAPTLQDKIMVAYAAVLPICIAGILLGVRAAWLICGAYLSVFWASLFANHPTAATIAVHVKVADMLLLVTAMIALGMFGFHRELCIADRSEELTALNEQLEASMQEIALSEATAQQQRDFADSLLNNIAPDVVFVVDIRGRLLRCNDAFVRLFGWERDALVGHDTRGLYTSETDYQQIAQTIAADINRQGYAVFEDDLVTRDRRPVRMACNVSPLPGTRLYVCVGRDVTIERRNQRNLVILRQLAQACASAAEEAAVARAALLTVLDGMQFNWGSILVPDPARPGFARALAFQAHSSPSEQAAWLTLLRESPIAADAPIAALRVLATGHAITDFSYQNTPIAHDAQIATVFSTPLQFAGKTFGALGLALASPDAPPLDTSDRDLLTSIAEEIATALHRARLYDDVKRLALIDPLTGLSNHRALQASLAQEVAKGGVHLPVSVLMLDLDLFRKFNEEHGHANGDIALSSIARIIQDHVPEGGCAARYGGEEFVIVLPVTDAERAHHLAATLQAAIAALPVALEAPGATAPITVSIGHATYPMHASAPASLLKAADLALYTAKRSGRNTVCAYSPLMIEANAHLLPTPITIADGEPGDISLPTGADLETVQAFITAIDLRDGYTAAHSDGVSRYAVAIGMELGLPTEHIEALRLGGLIHDIGKIGVPDGVLRKPGKLDDDEWRQMQLHAAMGAEILRPVEKLRHLIPLVRWHHERLDGSGYPDGLTGNQIPHLVRILSVADVFEAFTAERPYHPGRPAWEGLRLLHSEVARGRMDPAVVQAFEDLLICQGLIEDFARGEQDLQAA